MSFSAVITVLRDVDKPAHETEDFVIYKTRASYRTRSTFQTVKKDGTVGKSRTQFIDVAFFTPKWKDNDNPSGPKKAPVTKEQLSRGTIVYVEGDLGINVVPKKGGGANELSYFPQIFTERFEIVGKREEQAEKPGNGAGEHEAAEPARRTPVQATTRLQPRGVQDPADDFPDTLFGV